MSEVSENLLSQELAFQLEQSRAIQARRCENGAPYIYFKDQNDRGRLKQGCCNSWECPRCAHMRAREEYGRIVEGAKKLWDEGKSLAFLTITCPGKEVSLREAEQGYLLWTNRLLSTLRANAHKQGISWAYAQVTERQKRKHPHSHILSTWIPEDGIPYLKREKLPNGRKAKHDCLWSEYWRASNVKAGLGIECDISLVRNPVSVANYIAKYLFKEMVNEKWPKGWKRVRYSHSWPKLPSFTPEESFPIVKREDWRKLEYVEGIIYVDSEETLEECYKRLIVNVVYEKGLFDRKNP